MPSGCRPHWGGDRRRLDLVRRRLADVIEPHGLTSQQFNVLRILRGADPAGATCTAIGERMINHDPDITRLLDRLESRGLAARERSKEDRRVVLTRITRQGLDLVAGIDRPVRAFLKARLGKLDQHDLTVLIGQLEQIREAFQIEKEKL